eukprot:7413863-Prorocentrum_lima.AAC.1
MMISWMLPKQVSACKGLGSRFSATTTDQDRVGQNYISADSTDIAQKVGAVAWHDGLLSLPA